MEWWNGALMVYVPPFAVRLRRMGHPGLVGWNRILFASPSSRHAKPKTHHEVVAVRVGRFYVILRSFSFQMAMDWLK